MPQGILEIFLGALWLVVAAVPRYRITSVYPWGYRLIQAAGAIVGLIYLTEGIVKVVTA